MSTITMEEAQSKLSDLIHGMGPGEEVIITENDQPVARLVVEGKTAPPRERKLGTLRGTVLYMAPDFDAPLDDFKEYIVVRVLLDTHTVIWAIDDPGRLSPPSENLLRDPNTELLISAGTIWGIAIKVGAGKTHVVWELSAMDHENLSRLGNNPASDHNRIRGRPSGCRTTIAILLVASLRRKH